MGELNQYEAANIQKAVQKYLIGWRRKIDLGDPAILKRIHQDMFDETWKWAGGYRQSDANLGVPWFRVPEGIKCACDDFRYWNEHGTYSVEEIAVRFHHRLVSIHPFPNGNGRHARLVADIYLRGKDKGLLTWGESSLLGDGGEGRGKYIQALKKADRNDFSDLLRLAKKK